MKLKEKELARRWKAGAFPRVLTEDGRVLQVLYPGRPSSEAGPDFRDAVLRLETGEILRGDVEVHVRARDWVAHGHPTDPNYRGVVLQVVAWKGSQGGKGAGVPTAQLLPLQGREPPSPDSLLPSLRGLQRCRGRDLLQVLERAGWERFLEKSARFQERISEEGEEQALYSGLLEALGYSQNKAPFRRLAALCPWEGLKRAVARSTSSPVLHIQALLLGSAGLLPSQRGLEGGLSQEALEVSWALERLWLSEARPALEPGRWRFFRIRPENQPQRRIVGAAHLVHRYLDRGLRHGLQSLLENGKALEEALMVEAQGFWRNHLDFHRRCPRAPALIGRARARDMVVNVALPYFYALGLCRGDRRLKGLALRAYRDCKALQENQITREMRGLLSLDSGLGRRAIHQQGLLHLYHLVIRGRI